MVSYNVVDIDPVVGIAGDIVVPHTGDEMILDKSVGVDIVVGIADTVAPCGEMVLDTDVYGEVDAVDVQLIWNGGVDQKDILRHDMHSSD